MPIIYYIMAIIQFFHIILLAVINLFPPIYLKSIEHFLLMIPLGPYSTGYLQWCKLHIFIWCKLQAPIVPTRSNLSDQKLNFENRRVFVFTVKHQT